jgi:DNA-nicking Smr family endonuclease
VNKVGKRRVSRPPGQGLRTLHVEVVVDELDLHGFTADAAERRLESFLDTHSVRSPGRVVRIVTGRGTRSAGAPVLLDVVREALAGWLAHRVDDWAVDLGGGAYLVRVAG